MGESEKEPLATRVLATGVLAISSEVLVLVTVVGLVTEVVGLVTEVVGLATEVVGVLTTTEAFATEEASRLVMAVDLARSDWLGGSDSECCAAATIRR